MDKVNTRRPKVGMEFPPWPCVYVIAGSKRRWKIGYSTEMGRRFEALQQASAYPLHIVATMPGTRALEAWFHRRFDKYRVHGEWFDLPKSVQAEVLRYMSGETPVPTDPVKTMAKKQATRSSGRVRHEQAQRWNGYAPSTGQPKYSKVRTYHVPPETLQRDS